MINANYPIFEIGNFASRLRDLMTRDNVTQQELADKLGAKRQTISQYVNGDNQPNAERLYEIAKIFDVSADYLIGIVNEPSKDLEIKDIHKKLGLSERVIQTLIFETNVLNKKTTATTVDEAIRTVNNLVKYMRSNLFVESADGEHAEENHLKKLQEIGMSTVPTNDEKINLRFNTWVAHNYCGCADVINKIVDDDLDDNANAVMCALGQIVNYTRCNTSVLLITDYGRENGHMDIVEDEDIFAMKLLRVQNALMLRQQLVENKKGGGS